MISLRFFQFQITLPFFQFFERLQEGGLFFMVPILVLLLVVCFFIIKGILVLRTKKDKLDKSITLLNSIGLLAVVWGMLGQLIGLVGMFDQMESISDISPSIFAGGLKISALPPIFGFFVFVVSRVASIIFTWIEKESEIK